jgi:hypothetical protein
MGLRLVQGVLLLSSAFAVGLVVNACAIGPSEVPPWAKNYEPVTTPTATSTAPSAPTSTPTSTATATPTGAPTSSGGDAGPPPADDAGGDGGAGGSSFADIYTSYLAGGTVGNCAPCHEMNPTGSDPFPSILVDNPTDAYSAIMNSAGSCSAVPTVFAWGTGNGTMPLNYTASAQGSAAAAAISAWVSASCPQ